MTNISYQLYSSREFYPVENSLKLIGENGCQEAEGVAGFIIKDDPADTDKALSDLKSALDANGLTMPTMHIMIDQLKSSPEQLIKCAKVLGCHTLAIAYLEEESRPTTASGWKDFATNLKPYAKPLLDSGISLAWHNHDFEFMPIDGSYPMAEILAGFPELKFEMDVAWVVVANVDPIAEIKKFSNRLIALHIKDKAPEGQNQDQDGWCNVGEGIVPWAEILQESKNHSNIKHFVLEHDNPKSDAEFVSVSVPNVQRLLANAGY